MKRTLLALVALAGGWLSGGCGSRADDPRVVVYTALDQIFSEQILNRFEEQSGIVVMPVHDSEATKTVGLVNRILDEKENPQCDVFWNNEVVRTVMLRRKGLLQPYASPSAVDIPEAFKDRNGFWHGFAARARVLIYNKDLLPATSSPQAEGSTAVPTSIIELTEAKWKGKVSLAYPLFGTTATHAAALFAYWGDEKASAYYRALKRNSVVIVDGNATAKDMVARGEVPLGFTDTDDANVALQHGKPVGIVFTDQARDEIGTLVIPNTVAIIKNCPHPGTAKRLVDFLLSRKVEQMLAESGSAQMPVRPDIPIPEANPSLAGIKAMQVDWHAVEERLSEVSRFMGNLFVR